MLSEFAIIALAIMNQVGLVNVQNNPDTFLGQFIKFSNIQAAAIMTGNGWNLYSDNSAREVKMEILPEKIKSSDLDVNAVSAYAMDVGTDYPLYDKNSKKKMPIASITKIMTALVVLDNDKLDDTVTISSKAMQIEGDKKGMTAGEKIKLGDLFKIMLIDSNNAAAYALAEHTGGSVENFVALMNEKAKMLGLADTKFVNPTGLDTPGDENTSTAYDLAQLTQYALNKDLIWETSRMQEATVYSIDKKQKHNVQNTDELLGKMDNVFGGKTGYTADAGQCLVLVSQSPDAGKHKIISVVLNAQDRFAETKKLVDWVFEVYRW